MTKVSAIVVDADNRQHDRVIDVDKWCDLLAKSLEACGVASPAEVGLAFVDTAEMTALNAEYMGGTGPTDVLSFPIDGDGQVPPGQPALVGDVVLCPEVAARATQPFEDELALLIVHGALHLVGHDHAEPQETAEMQRLERQLLMEFYRR